MFLIDFLFPKACLSCGRLGSYICLPCQRKLKSIEGKYCFYCGGESISNYTHPACRRIGGVDGLITFFQYGRVLGRIIKNIKYRGVKGGLNELISLVGAVNYSAMMKMVDKKASREEQIRVSFIPLSHQRQARRGFNQAELIANAVAKRLGIKQESLLVKTRTTLPQANTKSIDERKKNLQGVFSVKKIRRPFPSVVFLADDILTTGTTIREATRVLKRAGARFVFAVTLAKV